MELQKHSHKTNLPASLKPSTVIREQPNKTALIAHICGLLLRLAKKYQIPNFDEESALLLAEDTMERFQYESIETVIKCLEFPPHTGEKNWRLTPDTISDWMAIVIEKEAEQREKEIAKHKQKVTFDVPDDTELSQETKDLVQNYLNSLAGFKSVSPMTADDVKKEGKEKLKQKSLSQGHPFAAKEKLIEWQLKQQWMKECFHPITQEPNENYLSFEEWRMM